MDQADLGIALKQCVGEFGTLLTIANFTLWVGVIAAIVISILTVAERIAVVLRKPAIGEGIGGSAGVASFLDSLKGLIAALAAAPPWFAIFLAGVLLLWCAGRFSPEMCQRSMTHPVQGAGPVDAKASPAK